MFDLQVEEPADGMGVQGGDDQGNTENHLPTFVDDNSFLLNSPRELTQDH